MGRERKLQYGISNQEISSPRPLSSPKPTPKIATEFIASNSLVRKLSPSRVSAEQANREIPFKRNIEFEEKIHREIRKRGHDLFLDVVVEKLYHVAFNKFGGIKKMMKMFRKKPDDAISYQEFVNNFKKHGLYEEFTSVEVDLLFDRILDRDDYHVVSHGNRNNTSSSRRGSKIRIGLQQTNSIDDTDEHTTASDNVDQLNEYDDSVKIPVSKIISSVQKVEMKDTDTYRDQKFLVKFLMNEVEKRRSSQRIAPTNQVTVKSTKNETKPEATQEVSTEYDASPLTDVPVSSRSQPIKLSLKEIDDTIDGILQTTSAVSLDPEERNRNKYARYIRLTNTKLDMIPFFQMKEKELELLHHNDSNLKNLLSDPKFTVRRMELLEKYKQRNQRPMTESLSLVDSNNMNEQIERSSLPMELTENRISRLQGNNFHNEGNRFDIRKPLRSVSVDSSRSKALYETFQDKLDYQPLPSNHSYQSLKHHIEAGSGIFPDSLFPPLLNHTTTIKGSKRYIPLNPTNKDQLGMSMGYNDTTTDTVHRQQSMTHDYYEPLTYHSHDVITRNNISDASKSYQQQENVRLARYKKSMNNQIQTKERVELEELNKKYKELKRCEYRNRRMIDYKNNILLNDLQSYRQSSNTLLTKRPNFAQAEKLYSSQVMPRVKEDRDFLTTSQIAFRSSL